MYEWSEEHQAIIDVVRRFVDEEIRPHLDDLEHNGVPPFAILRKMYDVFGLKALARESFQRQLERKLTGGGPEPDRSLGHDPAMTLIPTIELCRVSPGLVTSLGVSTGLAAHNQQARHACSDAAVVARLDDAGQSGCLGHHRARLWL